MISNHARMKSGGRDFFTPTGKERLLGAGRAGDSRSMDGDVSTPIEVDAGAAGLWQRVPVLGIDLWGDSHCGRAPSGAGRFGCAVVDFGDADFADLPVERQEIAGAEG